MEEQWDQARIQSYIDNGIEESTTLDYKGAGALGKSAGKKKEIAKDVSAMANTAGGIIIYGVSEYQEDDKKHKPEKPDPVDRTQFSKEWLDQVITSTIQPRIERLVIHSVTLKTGTNDVAYVVDIPKGTTAHQVTVDKDCRYYERSNFITVRMEDDRIRDVMNRAVVPKARARFGYKIIKRTPREYELTVKVVNEGNTVINHYKLELTFPNLDSILVELLRSMSRFVSEDNLPYQLVRVRKRGKPGVSVTREGTNLRVVYRSSDVLFPHDSRDVGSVIDFRYRINDDIECNLENLPPLTWILYADEMPFKKGEISFPELIGHKDRVFE